MWPSDGKAAEANATKIQPLIKKIPGLREELAKPRSFRADRYAFSNLVSYFCGSGTKIISKSCQLVLGDEIDQYQSPPNVNQVKEMQKRTRSYDHSIVGLVCTPTTQNGPIWQEYIKGSQGKWFLRCKGCGELTLDSSNTNNLQFESEYVDELKTYKVKRGSCALICPSCKHEHTYEDCRWMNMNGAWVHKFPELMDEHISFQFGALASQLKSLNWDYIAQQQLDAGKSADISMQMSFSNSIRGLPWMPRAVTKEEIASLKERHCWTTELSKDDIELIIVTSDTMDDFSSYGVFAWDVHDNIWMLECGEVPSLELTDEKREELNNIANEEGRPPVQCLQDIVDKQYLGLNVGLVVIDAGGHRADLVRHFIKSNWTISVQQKGSSMVSKHFKLAEKFKDDNHMIISNANYFKETLIYQLYSQNDTRENFLYFNPDIPEKNLTEIRDVQPDPTAKFGHLPANWKSKTCADHTFDCLKYVYLARDFALEYYTNNRFAKCESPMLRRRMDKIKKNQ